MSLPLLPRQSRARPSETFNIFAISRLPPATRRCWYCATLDDTHFSARNIHRSGSQKFSLHTTQISRSLNLFAPFRKMFQMRLILKWEEILEFLLVEARKTRKYINFVGFLAEGKFRRNKINVESEPNIWKKKPFFIRGNREGLGRDNRWWCSRLAGVWGGWQSVEVKRHISAGWIEYENCKIVKCSTRSSSENSKFTLNLKLYLINERMQHSCQHKIYYIEIVKCYL